MPHKKQRIFGCGRGRGRVIGILPINIISFSFDLAFYLSRAHSFHIGIFLISLDKCFSSNNNIIRQFVCVNACGVCICVCVHGHGVFYLNAFLFFFRKRIDLQ